MATLIGDLIEVLDKQIVLYNDLYEIGKEKKNIIIVNDLETLTTMNTVENTIISKINRFEKQRIEIIKDICDVLAIKSTNFTLTELAQTVTNADDKKDILEVRDRLNTVLDNLVVVNTVNKDLVESSLEYVNFSLNAIRSASQPMESGYENDLKKK